MPTLDLHNLYHYEIEKHVTEFINFLDPPFRIITGKSGKVRSIVIEIIERYDWTCHDEHYQNYGCLVIMEGKTE